MFSPNFSNDPKICQMNKRKQRADRGGRDIQSKFLTDRGNFGWRIEVKLSAKEEAWLLSHSPRAKNDSLNPKALHQPQKMAPLDI